MCPCLTPLPLLLPLRSDYVLKLEDELVAFVTGQERKPHLVLPPRSSYQRLIAYRLCARFKLQKATASQEREALMANGFPPTVGTASAPKNIMGNGGDGVGALSHGFLESCMYCWCSWHAMPHTHRDEFLGHSVDLRSCVHTPETTVLCNSA